MTTAAAAAQYEAEFLAAHRGRGYAEFNPHNKPVNELPVIYGFNNGGSTGFMHAQLISADGEALGSHLCSSEGYMRADLGILEGTREDRHETFKKHYPDGYRMDFVGHADCPTHDGLNAAIAAHTAKYPPAPSA
jgi:hypothetical protein